VVGTLELIDRKEVSQMYRRWRRSGNRERRIGEELQFNDIGEKVMREEKMERRSGEGANVIINY
jgi:hypothetical protein